MKNSAAFTKVFLSAPQLNPSNSGKGSKGNYKCSYDKTHKSKTGELRPKSTYVKQGEPK